MGRRGTVLFCDWTDRGMCAGEVVGLAVKEGLCCAVGSPNGEERCCGANCGVVAVMIAVARNRLIYWSFVFDFFLRCVAWLISQSRLV